MALVIANIHFPIGDVNQVLCCKQASERDKEKGKKERGKKKEEGGRRRRRRRKGEPIQRIQTERAGSKE